jgi:RND family efflux transporter MFP subunit
MILSDTIDVSTSPNAARSLLFLGALAMPFLPAPASGHAPVVAVLVTAEQAESRDQSARAATSAAKDQKPNTATAHGDQKGPSPDSPPLGKVLVRQPLVKEVSDYGVFAGQIVAARDVELRARVSGTLITVACRPGQVVKRDDRLFVIDPRPYRAALDKAEAEHDGALSRQKRSQIKLANTKRLQVSKVVSQDETDLSEAELLEATATVKAAVAARDVSRLNLEFTEVRAPFDGRVSDPVLGPGNVVVADTTLLATIVSTDPVCVAFDIDQRTVLNLNRLRLDGKIKGKTWLGLSIDVGLPDEEDFPRRGKIDSDDIRIDSASGTARWRAVIPNPDGLLIPSMFVRVRLVTGAPHKALLVPEQAVLTDGAQKSVLVVTGQNIVQRRPVKTGQIYDGLQIVNGLQSDEWVVIYHLHRIREGEKVLSELVPPPVETFRRDQSSQ